MSKNKDTSYSKGLRAEHYAAWYLRFKGYKILARRYKTRKGEVDIIAKRGKVIAIIEVKARKDLEMAKQAITYRGAKRILAAARYWLYKQGDLSRFKIRFDVVFICPRHFPIHIKDYFLLY